MASISDLNEGVNGEDSPHPEGTHNHFFTPFKNKYIKKTGIPPDVLMFPKV